MVLGQPCLAQADAAHAVQAALERLAQAGPFSLAYDGAFEREGDRLTDIHAEASFAGPMTYEIAATIRIMDRESVHRVVRIGDRQWEWRADQAGWRATEPGADMVSQSVAGLLSSLSEVRDITEGESQEIGGDSCTSYHFSLPPGVATIQGLPVEGEGCLWVRDSDGLPVRLDLEITTAIGATGTATVTLSGHGDPVEIRPPGLGGQSLEGQAPLRGASLAAALEGREVVHWTLEAKGEGQPVIDNILPAGATSTVLDVYVFPARPGAVARLRAGERLLGEMIVDDEFMCEYFLSVDDEEGVPDWSCRRIDPQADDAPWRLHTQVLEQCLADRPLTLADNTPESQDGARVYSFDPGGAETAGLFLPLVREELVTGEAEMSGAVRLGDPFGELLSIHLAVEGQTEGGEHLAATEEYTFSYRLSEAERDDLEQAFERAREMALAEEDARLERAREVSALVERVARECAWVVGDPTALEVKLARLARTPGVLAAWVLDTEGSVLASVGGEADHPPMMEALGEYRPGSPTSAREVGEGDPRLTVAPVVDREDMLLGYVVARWSAK
jgi:hypothetical protein